MTQRTYPGRALRGVVLVALLLIGLTGIGSTTASAQGRRTFTGEINGAKFRVEVPARWNGTLVLYSHGYFPPGVPEGIGLTNREETEPWLLDHGYALAASDFTGRFGAVYDQGPRDQLALLDWFDAHVGRPRHTVAIGSSMGAALSVMLAERNPHRFAGVAAMCGPLDLNGQWNSMLDASFALRTLLAPNAGIELVHVTDPAPSIEALQGAVFGALNDETGRGRARLALASAIGNVPGWTTANAPRSTELEVQIGQQAAQLVAVHIFTFGPSGRKDLERRAGGNPSWNVGVDYRRQLARSGERDLVLEAYRAAGAEADLDADLDRLAAEPRIAPDPRALGWMYRFGVPRATTPVPVVTWHNIADSAEPGHERWYAEQVRRAGNPDQLRQLYAERPGHCSFSAAEEIVMLRALFERINSGRWPSTKPGLFNGAAGTFGPSFHKAFDFATFGDVDVRPAFTGFTPSPLMRPSR